MPTYVCSPVALIHLVTKQWSSPLQENTLQASPDTPLCKIGVMRCWHSFLRLLSYSVVP